MAQHFDELLQSSGRLLATTTNIYDVDPIESLTLIRESGTLGDERFIGTAAAEFYRARAGNDSLVGRGGDDTLIGGVGLDTIRGGDGDDDIRGGAGADTLRGGVGADTLRGGAGSDSIRGGAGDDEIRGGAGADTIRGGVGNDDIRGGAGDDDIRGGVGDDLLDGRTGNNLYHGGSGADNFVIGTGGFNTVLDLNLAEGDEIVLAGGVSFDDLTFTNEGDGTLISNGTLELAFVEDASVEETSTAILGAFPGTLEVAFESIELPETIDFGAEGSVVLRLTNNTGSAINGPITLDLLISTDDDQDSDSDLVNDGLLNQVEVVLDLATGESTTVQIDYSNLSSVVAPGAYHLLAGVSGEQLTSALVSGTPSDPVLIWHATALNAIQEFGEPDNDTTAIGIEPTVGSRGLAIVQTSVFNAVNAFEGTYESYLGLDPGTPADGASIEAAVAGAAIAGIANVFPGTADLQQALLAQLKSSLDLTQEQASSLLIAGGLDGILGEATPGLIPSYADPLLVGVPTPTGIAPEGISQDILDGFLLGVNAASQIIEARSDDGFVGFFEGPDDPAGYTAPGEFEAYAFTPEFQIDAVTGESVFGDVLYARSPNWGLVRPFAGVPVLEFLEESGIDQNGDGFFLDGRPFPSGPDTAVSDFQRNRYADEIEQVRTLGALQDTALTEVTRSQDETEVAIFWAYDRTDTFRPYGQLHQIAQEATFRHGESLTESAHTLALTGIALADAAITAWSQKFAEAQPRPADVISGDGQGTPIAAIDNIDETIADPDWVPLLPNPPFPDFLSGHSTFGGAFGGLLSELYPEVTGIQVVSQDVVPGNPITETSDNSLFNIDDFTPVREYESYLEIGAEDAISRVYGGVHILEATQDAFIVGSDIGRFVADNLLLAVAPELTA